MPFILFDGVQFGFVPFFRKNLLKLSDDCDKIERNIFFARLADMARDGCEPSPTSVKGYPLDVMNMVRAVEDAVPYNGERITARLADMARDVPY